MSRIVLTTIGSLGDLHPMIAMGLELRDRGHEIVFATLKDYQAKIESLGFEFHSLRPDHISPEDPEMMALMMDLQKGTERIVCDYIFANIRETYTDLMVAARDADFIVTVELVYATRLVVEKLNIPWALSVLAPISFFSPYDPPVLPNLLILAKLRRFGRGVNQGVVNLAKFITHSWSEPLHQLRQELGLARIGNPMFEDKFSPYLNLALFSSTFASAQPDWAAKTVMTGFPFYDGQQQSAELTSELQDFLDSGEPPIVFTLGSAAVLSPGDFYTQSIQAAQQLNLRAVLLMGKNSPPVDLPTGMVAFDYAPYSKVFPRACAIVHQGGIGTTAQALRSGHPTLVVPYSHDQPDNAARLERLGTSRTIPRKHYTATRAIKELRALLDHSRYAAKAAEIGRIIQMEDGVRIACDEVEKKLRSISASP
jgi:rhamnosyltransferase subunit B